MKVKINVIKFETINGKKVGKAFSFPMDPKAMAKHKTEATVKKKIEEYILKSKIFRKEELKNLKYDMKEFLTEWRQQIPVVVAEMAKEQESSPNNAISRITPERITRLAANEVFVFGSNSQGLHYGGAAKVAAEKFGAIMGQGHGMQGKSYAIDSMSGIADMAEDIRKFCEYAKANPKKCFLVTQIGCGIAGYRTEEVAPLFKECIDLDNVCLPSSFWQVLGFPQSKQTAYDLERFVRAQEDTYARALNEIRKGKKSGHWIWFIFPQQKGLGHSYNSKFYGLDGQEEALAYWQHPILGARLREMCEALLAHEGKASIEQIMGSDIDVLKLQTCMNLFNRIAPNDVFRKVLDAFF